MLQGPAHTTLCVRVYWYAVVTMTTQVRHVKTGSFTVDLAVKNIWTEMCRRITRLVRDLYIRRPVLLAEVGKPNGGDRIEGDDVIAPQVGTYKFPR